METWEKRPLWQPVAWRARLLSVYSEIQKLQKFRKPGEFAFVGAGRRDIKGDNNN